MRYRRRRTRSRRPRRRRRRVYFNRYSRRGGRRR